MRSLRTEATLTQEKLAWDCDLSNAYLSQVEAGHRLPSVEVLDKLAQRLGLELVDLFATEPLGLRASLLEAARRGDFNAAQAALDALRLPPS